MKVRRWPRRTVKLLQDVIDVHQCRLCGDTRAVNGDPQTFTSPPPLECRECGHYPMSASRYRKAA